MRFHLGSRTSHTAHRTKLKMRTQTEVIPAGTCFRRLTPKTRLGRHQVEHPSAPACPAERCVQLHHTTHTRDVGEQIGKTAGPWLITTFLL